MITTRRATAEDKEFLWILKVAAMRQYVEQVYGWDDTMQYDYFEKNFHPEALEIIQYDGQDVGIYKLLEREESYYLSQIEITPEFQNKGIGSTIIQRIIDAVAVQGQPLKGESCSEIIWTPGFFSDRGIQDAHPDGNDK